MHELAHLLTYEQFGNRVSAHGREWKTCFGDLLKQFLDARCFPEPLELELLRSIRNPAASSCAEVGLIRVLRQFDATENKQRGVLVEELAVRSQFRTPEGRLFRVEKRLRKRFLCTETETGKQYLFSPVYEVIPVVDAG